MREGGISVVLVWVVGVKLGRADVECRRGDHAASLTHTRGHSSRRRGRRHFSTLNANNYEGCNLNIFFVLYSFFSFFFSRKIHVFCFLVGAFRRKTQTIVVTFLFFLFFKTNEVTDFISWLPLTA